MDLQAALTLIKPYPHFPKQGILFQDIHPIMDNAEARKAILDHLEARYREYKLDAVVGLDSRGYYFGVPLADRLGLPFVPARKAGKLPGPVKKISYGLEYGESAMELQEDALKPGQRVVVIDDLMATGGTAAAACALLQQVGAVVVEVHVMVELDGLKGRHKLPEGVQFYSLASRPCDVEE